MLWCCDNPECRTLYAAFLHGGCPHCRHQGFHEFGTRPEDEEHPMAKISRHGGPTNRSLGERGAAGGPQAEVPRVDGGQPAAPEPDVEPIPGSTPVTGEPGAFEHPGTGEEMTEVDGDTLTEEAPDAENEPATTGAPDVAAPQGGAAPDPSAGTIDEVLANVHGSGDPEHTAPAEGWEERALKALEAEQAKARPRATLVARLEAMLEAATDASSDQESDSVAGDAD